MARFRCRACHRQGDFIYNPEKHACPRCGSPNVQIALGIEEMPDSLIDRIIKALGATEPLDRDTSEED